MAHTPWITVTLCCSMIMVIGIEQNFVQSFLRGQGNYHDYTHAWTKLRNEVVSWIFGALYACRHYAANSTTLRNLTVS